jgi:hypothetical protein
MSVRIQSDMRGRDLIEGVAVGLGALGSPMDALLYSVDSITTRGASGLILQRHWRMMGALEAQANM